MSESSRSDAQGRSASYRIEDLDAEAELRRLEAQVRLVVPTEHRLLKEIGVRPESTFVDIGCGPGFFAERAARELLDSGARGGRMIGVDVDEKLIWLARKRAEGLGLPLEYVVGAGAEIPLPDEVADVTYARFLFQHLEHPQDVLAQMVRITRPGGLVAIVDTDDGSLVMHPEPVGFSRLVEASGRAQNARGGDRRVGRKLKRYLASAGLEDPSTKVHSFTTEDVGVDPFIEITVGFKAGVLRPPFITAAEVQETVDDLDRVRNTPGFFGHALGYLAWGRKPT
jgi:ubiquinone/menaquinone biosynthesis C-methylase UbiE